MKMVTVGLEVLKRGGDYLVALRRNVDISSRIVVPEIKTFQTFNQERSKDKTIYDVNFRES